MEKIIRWQMCILFGTLFLIFLTGCGQKTADYVSSQTENMQTESAVSIESEKTETIIYVYVCGAVEQTGVYEMPLGSRICDLFQKAGGLRTDAADEYWNQAQILEDGQMIYVPTQAEVQNGDVPAGTNGKTTDKEDGKVNINQAELEELMTIPGIGEAKAKAILSYRKEHGAFSSIEEVKQVEGIKEGLFSKMQDYIKID